MARGRSHKQRQSPLYVNSQVLADQDAFDFLSLV